MENIDMKIVTLAGKCAEELGYKLVSCTWQMSEGQKVLEVLIDKKEGISLIDISRFNDLLSPQLDEIKELNFPYVLDCASPGAERFVAPQEVFDNPEQYVGEYMEVTTVTGEKYLGTVDEIDLLNGIKIRYFIKGRKKITIVKFEEVLKTQLRVKI